MQPNKSGQESYHFLDHFGTLDFFDHCPLLPEACREISSQRKFLTKASRAHSCLTCRETAIPRQYLRLLCARGNRDLSKLNGFTVVSYRVFIITACSICISCISFQSPYGSACEGSGTVPYANRKDFVLFGTGELRRKKISRGLLTLNSWLP